MLIIIGNFIEIKKDYLEKFKKQIEIYESDMKKNGKIEEKQEIENEFLGTIVDNSIYDNLIDKYTSNLQQKADDIREEHRKQISKSERKNKRRIKMARAIGKTGTIFHSKVLLELSIKKLREIKKNRELLNQKIDSDWKELDYYMQEGSKTMESVLNETIDEMTITERMKTAKEHNIRTNEELENVLSEKILCEAIQDKHGIGNVFQRLLGRFSKKDEMGER